MLVMCGVVLWRGDRAAKLAGLACVAAWFFTPIAHFTHSWVGPQWGILSVDLLLLLSLLWLALRSDRIWLLFAAAFQLLEVVMHLAMAADRSVAPLPYALGLAIWSYLVLLTVGVGGWTGRRSDKPQSATDVAAPTLR